MLLLPLRWAVKSILHVCAENCLCLRNKCRPWPEAHSCSAPGLRVCRAQLSPAPPGIIPVSAPSHAGNSAGAALMGYVLPGWRGSQLGLISPAESPRLGWQMRRWLQGCSECKNGRVTSQPRCQGFPGV